MESHISYVRGSFRGRNPLWFDSSKRPPVISEHSVFAFWFIAYGRFECRSKMMSTIGMFQGAEKKSKREPTFDFGCGQLRFYIRVNLFFRGKSSAAKILGTKTHCCAMEAMIIEIEEKMVKFRSAKLPADGLFYYYYQWKYYVPRSVAFVGKLIRRCSCNSLECWPRFALSTTTSWL